MCQVASHEVKELASTSVLSRSFPTLKFLAAPFVWLFGSRRRVLTAATVLAAMMVAPPLWWATQIFGLPDIGDPFDVRAFQSFAIPDERNAFVLYHQAADRLKPLVTTSKEEREKIDLHATWSKADPIVRRWVEENREALQVFRQGTARPDALEPALAEKPDPLQAFRTLQALALLEASRAEEQGDTAAAWVWYRAALRATYHMGVHGTIITRHVGQRRASELRRRFSTWAADPRTPPELIRHAIDDVNACGSLIASELYTLRAEYSCVEFIFDTPYDPGRQLLISKLNGALDSRGYQLDSDQIRALANAWQFWRRDRERSRRVIRLAVANWLAYYEMPPNRRPAPDSQVSSPFDFYSFGPDAPATARALAREALDRWRNTTYDAYEILRSWDLRKLQARAQANHRALLILLATELYRRDHQSEPPSDEALVGPYLERLPDDGTDEPGRADAARAAPEIRAGSVNH
jgi:hypothetical protein